MAVGAAAPSLFRNLGGVFSIPDSGAMAGDVLSCAASLGTSQEGNWEVEAGHGHPLGLLIYQIVNERLWREATYQSKPRM